MVSGRKNTVNLAEDIIPYEINQIRKKEK